MVGYNLQDRLTFFDNAYLQVKENQFRKALDAERAIMHATDGLYSDLYRFRPQVLLAVSAFLLPTKLFDLARLSGTRVVILMTEQPYETERELDVAQHADLVLLNDPVNIDRFREVTRAEYVPHAFRPHLHKPGPVDPEAASEFCFVGTGFESRIRFFEAMDLAGIDVALGGNWMQLGEDSPLRKYLAHDIDACCDNAQAVRLYRSSKASLNLYRRETEDNGSAVGWACGPREIELAATGCFFLRDPRPEGDEMFPMLPTFAGPEDAGEILRWWLAHDGLREEAARQARAAVADRTFVNNAAALMRLLEKE